jgi:glyoxylase-like metal-dependent hydrolase (beta-lactamase superfamily II)
MKPALYQRRRAMTQLPKFLIATLLATATAGPAFAKSVPVAPAAHAFKLGALSLYALRDELNVVPNDGSVFGTDVGPSAVAKVLRQAGASDKSLTLGVDALLVELPGRYTLIDTGLGPKVGGVLLQSLRTAGVRPDQITDVLITHSHPDHIGGLIAADGKLAFPNATIRMSETEWRWLSGKGGPVVATLRPRVKTFQPGHEVVPGITAIALPGHTPGHVGYEITSRGQRLLDIGDSAHSAVISLREPQWTIGYDNDAKAGVANREKLFARLATSKERIFAPHFPFPGVGTIGKAGEGYVWQPSRN